MKNSFNKFVFIFVLISFQFTYQANATDWYVDNAATAGANNGTSWTDAWQSFADIVWESINPGDVIYISGGATEKVYYERLLIGASGTEGNPITIKVGQDQGHNGNVVITNNDSNIGSGVGVSIHFNTYITIDGSVNGERKLKVQHCNGAGIRIYYTHHIKLTDIDVYHNGSEEGWLNSGIMITLDEYVEPKPMIEVSNCFISSNWQDGMSLFGPPAPGFGYVSIHDNEIMPTDDGVETGLGGLDFYNNNVHTRVYEGGLGHTDGIAFIGAEYYRIYNNVFHDFRGGTAYINFEAAYKPNNVWTPRPANQVYIYNNLMYESEIVTMGRIPARHAFRAGNPYRGSCPDGLYDDEGAKALFNHLVEMGYVGEDYFITESFFGLNDYSEMILNSTYESDKENIFNILACYKEVGSSLSGISFGGNILSTISVSGVVIANNVIVNMPATAISMGCNNYPAENMDGVIIANNVVHNCFTNNIDGVSYGAPVNIHSIEDTSLISSFGSGAEIIYDNNIISEGDDGTSGMYLNGNEITYEEMVNTYGLNINGANIDPSLDVNFRPDSENDPTIDKGMDISAYFDYDLDGVSRPQGLAWDIGAYEYPTGTTINSKPTDKTQLLQNYPNPFISNTTIEYSLPENTDVEITLYDVTGRKIQTLFEGHQIAGEHTLDIELNTIEAGVFFFQLEAGTYKATSKCIVTY